mmetsp:Transcript_63300/g.125169  ORF Transcript_63300/g.125169 Transcript_63300/m.125169 type:complete len:232 (-) Transcript_63300:109-804(-)|eukprot:CAMPEP_0172722076 /NCGR_PEP_ID=MMETSP1074-20121228/80593_1 /TAXON_ID=2916 /ORGANISM="Ceratium fusus, Strain PA161109" /LENGTH=231 /DNA_ID=CAMNT_0013547987 /DNA_START=102 /DNA_END=797 /DNA_ORIENTATION=+
MACCCVNEGDTIEVWEMPIEPEHATPESMDIMQAPGRREDHPLGGCGPREDQLMVGAVTIPAGSSVGLNCLHSPRQNRVVVCDVEPGPWQAWNEAHPRHNVDVGDEVLEVNRKRGDYRSILSELSCKGSGDGTTMTMSIRRPTEHCVFVSRGADDSLGLDLAPQDNGALFVCGIFAEGVLSAWNRRNAHRRIRSLDRIVEVNRFRGNAYELMDLLDAARDLEIVFQTHPDD